MPCYPIAERIGFRKATRGTETSKYPEEEKSTEIASVAASERAPAQTHACVSLRALLHVGSWDHAPGGPQTSGAVRNRCRSRTGMERPAEQGKSPVGETAAAARMAPE